jgi:hypothetical protein
MKSSEWWRSPHSAFGAQTFTRILLAAYGDCWLQFRDTEGGHATRYVGMVRNRYWRAENELG